MQTVNEMFGGSSELLTMLPELCSTIWFDYHMLGSSQKLGGAATKKLIDGSKKLICWLSFEFKSPRYFSIFSLVLVSI